MPGSEGERDKQKTRSAAIPSEHSARPVSPLVRRRVFLIATVEGEKRHRKDARFDLGGTFFFLPGLQITFSVPCRKCLKEKPFSFVCTHEISRKPGVWAK